MRMNELQKLLLAEHGIRATSNKIRYAIEAGHISEPARDAFGWRVFTDAHVAGIVAWLGKRNRSPKVA